MFFPNAMQFRYLTLMIMYIELHHQLNQCLPVPSNARNETIPVRARSVAILIATSKIATVARTAIMHPEYLQGNELPEPLRCPSKQGRIETAMDGTRPRLEQV